MEYPIGFFHIDIAEVQTAEGKLRLFVGIDRTSKLAYAELYQEAGKMIAAQFLRNLIVAVPYAIHTVLTDTNQARQKYAFHHIFDRVYDENGIEHRLRKITHPWTNGQVERLLLDCSSLWIVDSWVGGGAFTLQARMSRIGKVLN